MPRRMEESLTIRLSKIYIDLMDKMVKKGVYGSKSEIIREALRLLFEKYGEKNMGRKRIKVKSTELSIIFLKTRWR